MKLKLVLPVVLVMTAALPLRAQDKPLPPEITVDQFPKFFEMIKSYPGEFRWRDEIYWYTSTHEARLQAAKEGKPILYNMASKGNLLGCT
jgi:hypothetical protein